MKATVYILKDPRNGEARYVGQTVKVLAARLSHHLSGKAIKKDAKRQWFLELKELGLKPIIEAVEEVDKANALEREAYWISYYEEQGANLVNQPVGVEGLYSEPTIGVSMRVPKSKISAYKKHVKEILKQWEVKPSPSTTKKTIRKKK